MKQSEKLNKLYELFGRTSENAQTLELEAGNVILSYLTLFVDPKNITNEEKNTNGFHTAVGPAISTNYCIHGRCNFIRSLREIRTYSGARRHGLR